MCLCYITYWRKSKKISKELYYHVLIREFSLSLRTLCAYFSSQFSSSSSCSHISDDILINLPQPIPSLNHFIPTNHHLLHPTSSKHKCIIVMGCFFYITAVTRGSWRSSSCRPIPSWRPLEMPRPLKMTIPPDLWVCCFYSEYRTSFLCMRS